jgi:transcriptional regulator with XRE-family HTH domain
MPRKTENSKATNIMVGAKLRALRQSMGITGEQLASKIGITYQQLSKYERGTNTMSLFRACLIARALGVSVLYFTDEERVEIPVSLGQRMAMEVSRNFMKIQNPEMQLVLNKMTKLISDNNQPV